MEPSYPLFESASPNRYLDRNDAQFVDIIHTNAGKLQDGGMGFPFPTAHADFWVNGGYFQPVCDFFYSLQSAIDEESIKIRKDNEYC